MSEVAASVTVIGSEEIQRYGWTTFDELLGAIRGLYVTNDRNFSSLGVRGISGPSSNVRLLVLIDGNPLVGTPFGESPTGNSLSISLSSIDRVEFVRGPGSALYGTGAMFGVINVITKKANELKFSPRDTTVTVSGAVSGDDFLFCVADQGRGVPSDKLRTIFERFSQVDASDSRDKGGSGLGLAISESIVAAHGGRIWAENNVPAGTRVFFTIPMAPSPLQSDQR